MVVRVTPHGKETLPRQKLCRGTQITLPWQYKVAIRGDPRGHGRVLCPPPETLPWDSNNSAVAI
jgi:hypothetical protein